MDKLRFLVVSELWETETAAFWYRPGVDPATIGTEVFLLPAAFHLEKDGSVTNSSRWAQFRYKAVEPPGDAMHETWTINALYEEILSALGLTGGVPTATPDDAISMLTMGTWWYVNTCGEPTGLGGYADPTADYLDREINGQDPTSNAVPSLCSQMATFGNLQDDGTTSSGNWLYCNMYDSSGNKSKRRDNTPNVGMAPIYSNWAWDWPVNRRIIYNGGSLEPCGWGGVTGTPWDATHSVIWHNGSGGWLGDVNDGVGAPHEHKPLGNDPHGKAPGLGERTPFIMKPEGHCRLHGYGLADGPYPEHYEPLETIFFGSGNPLGHGQVINPAIHVYVPSEVGRPGQYPIIATTYRCTEHWQAGAATRHLPWLAETFPDVCVEMSPGLAVRLGKNTGDMSTITTKRGTMQAYTIVTNRFEDYQIFGVRKFHVGIFWHWGYKGVATGDSANLLTSHVGDANTRIPEYKAFLCNIT
jgi:formate dehydrogenase major subunit